MVIPFESMESRVYRLDTLRREASLNQVREFHEQWLAGRIPLATLIAEIGHALDAYASTAIDVMLGYLPATDQPSASMLDGYYDSVMGLAAAMRDAVSDASARHAVAQVLQERVLRAEIRLRESLAARSPVVRDARQRPSTSARRSRTAIS